jgi:hypothetical protein
MAFFNNCGDANGVQNNVNPGSLGRHSKNLAYNMNPEVARGLARGGMSNATTTSPNNPGAPMHISIALTH